MPKYRHMSIDIIAIVPTRCQWQRPCCHSVARRYRRIERPNPGGLVTSESGGRPAYAPSFRALRTHRGGLAPWQQRRATELLAGHLAGSLRLATLARECGLSVSHFTRSFRQSFGTSPHKYRIRQRVERAKQLLSDSSCPLSELALHTGFADQAAFSRTFKAVVGSSPGRWRRETQHRGSHLIVMSSATVSR